MGQGKFKGGQALILSTEDVIEDFIDTIQKFYKKNCKDKILFRKLNRHETVTIDDVEFTYWREFVCYKMCEYLKQIVPSAYVECNLDGNDSNIVIELDEKQGLRLEQVLQLATVYLMEK